MRSGNSGYLEVIVLIMFILINLIIFCSAIRINEIELNPAGADSGNEWVELYSEEEVDIGDYKLKNNDGDELNLSGVFLGFYVYTFEKQWLDNSDEAIFLYQKDDLIDSSKILKDDKNNNNTWGFCSGWIFGESSKGIENSCGREAGEDEENGEGNNEEGSKGNLDDSSNEDLEKSDDKMDNKKDRQNKLKAREVIYLEPKDIKTPNNTKVIFRSANEKIKYYAVYGFALFCIVIIVLLLIDRRK